MEIYKSYLCCVSVEQLPSRKIFANDAKRRQTNSYWHTIRQTCSRPMILTGCLSRFNDGILIGKQCIQYDGFFTKISSRMFCLGWACHRHTESGSNLIMTSSVPTPINVSRINRLLSFSAAASVEERSHLHLPAKFSQRAALLTPCAALWSGISGSYWLQEVSLVIHRGDIRRNTKIMWWNLPDGSDALSWIYHSQRSHVRSFSNHHAKSRTGFYI